MNPGTRIRSTAMNLFTREGYMEFKRSGARYLRRLRLEGPRVRYFHQADDPYSQLVVQKLDQLRQRFKLPFEIQLVSGPAAEFQGDVTRFKDWAYRDAASVAEFFGTSLPPFSAWPDEQQVRCANQVLVASLGADNFAEVAAEVGERLWLNQEISPANPVIRPEPAIRKGNQLRRRLGHYMGAMFHFEGEWYWGLDRLHHLETRLIDEGYCTDKNPLPCVPIPTPPDTSGYAAADVTLEYFPSLRSPYTAIGHRRVVDLVARSGVKLVLRPVMPMMMRGVPNPFAKQQYIITDAAREGRFHGTPFGKIVDPFGDPVRAAFALFPAVNQLGQGLRFISEYLSAAWFEGLDITKAQTLQTLVERTGLDDKLVRQTAAENDWQPVLDENLNEMLGAGLWGVPSFRVSGGDAEPFSCWGQDRIWRVEAEIFRRASKPQGTSD